MEIKLIFSGSYLHTVASNFAT